MTVGNLRMGSSDVLIRRTLSCFSLFFCCAD